MKIKNVYIFTGNNNKDFDFMDKDIEEKNIDARNVFTDVSFNRAFKYDVAQGFGGWDGVRMVSANGDEVVYLKLVGKNRRICGDEVMPLSEAVEIKEAEKNKEKYY